MDVYLSRVPLDILHCKGIEFASSPYRLHAAIEASLPADSERVAERGRVLWRLDEPIGRTDCLWLYILSPAEPNYALIVEQAGLPADGAWEVKPYNAVLDNVRKGQHWQFRLKANPARKVMADKGRILNPSVRGTIQGHVTVEQQQAWLLSRAEAHGFRVLPSSSGADALVVSHRRRERFKRGGQTVTLATAQFDGVLEVVDATAFRRTLGFGIGRAKGFGCGLLTIAPVRGEL